MYKIVLLLLAVLLAPLPSYGAWVKVQQKEIALGSTCSPNCTADFASNTTTNNLIAVGVRWQSPTTTLTCSGDAGSGWTNVAASLLQSSGLGDSMQWCFALASGGNTVDVSFSSGNFNTAAIAFEYSGNATTSIQDKAAGAEGTSTNVSAGTVTTDTDNELLLVFVYNDSGTGGTWTKASGWTAIEYNPDVTHQAADYQGFATAGSVELNITFSNSIPYIASGVTFRPLSNPINYFRRRVQ